MVVHIATGNSVTNANINNRSGEWSDLATKLTTFKVTPEKYADYVQMPPDKQGRIKDVGYYIGGHFSGSTRARQDLLFRSLITLDLDFLPADDFDDVHFVYQEYEYVLHSTHKHSPEKPRYRLVLPLCKTVDPDKYQAIARYVANLLNIDYFDETAFRVTQLMYWPSRSVDGVEVAVHNQGGFIDPDVVLATYKDWTDFSTWPTTAREGKLNSTNKKQEDPYDKPGIVGAFCRTYNIVEAIEQFELPYESTEWGNRYRPLGSTGASGAVVYPSGQCKAAFLYSNHESDAASSQLVNSWDLVRLNKFGELDKGYVGSIGKAPSQLAMTAFAMELPEVNNLLMREEFSPVGEEEDEVIGPAKLTYDTLAAEIVDRLAADGPLDRDSRKKMINRVAAAKLDSSDTDVLAALIRKACEVPQPSKQAVLEQIRISSKRLTAELGDENGTIADIEVELIEKTLEEHYGGGRHIKRVDKNWWTYKDGVWGLDDDEKVRGKMQKTFIKLRTERPEDVMPLVSAVGDSKTSALVGTMWKMFQSHLAEKEDSPDPLKLRKRIPLPVINCLNGELHFAADGSFVVKKHNPESFHTIQIATEYDPNATCPEWDNFMQMIFDGNEDMIRHAEELGGYTVQMSRWLKAWVLFHGKGDTGKSTFADVIQALLGTAAISRELSAYGGDRKSNFAEAGLLNKLLVLEDDFGKGSILPDGFIKTVSEEKMITGEVKYGGDVRFICRSLPVVLSNYWPMTRDLTDAFRGRAQVFDFKHKITAAERDDEKKSIMLRDELPGILNRFVAGVSRLRARDNWLTPDACVKAHKEWVTHTNPASMFVEEMLEPRAGAKMLATDCWKAYVNWFKSSHPSGKPSSKVEFYERMESLLGDGQLSGGHLHFMGVSLREFDS